MAVKPSMSSIECGKMNQESKKEILEFLSQRGYYVIGVDEITVYRWEEPSGDYSIRIQSCKGIGPIHDDVIDLKDLDIELLFDVLVDMVESFATEGEKVSIYREDIVDRSSNQKKDLGFTVKIEPPINSLDRWFAIFPQHNPNHNNLPDIFDLKDVETVQPNPGDVLVFNGQQWVAQTPTWAIQARQ